MENNQKFCCQTFNRAVTLIQDSFLQRIQSHMLVTPVDVSCKYSFFFPPLSVISKSVAHESRSGWLEYFTLAD